VLKYVSAGGAISKPAIIKSKPAIIEVAKLAKPTMIIRTDTIHGRYFFTV
jgi:hypothetical protein